MSDTDLAWLGIAAFSGMLAPRLGFVAMFAYFFTRSFHGMP